MLPQQLLLLLAGETQGDAVIELMACLHQREGHEQLPI
jgi:hypothetical protein